MFPSVYARTDVCDMYDELLPGCGRHDERVTNLLWIVRFNVTLQHT